jgi:hypothetical protein
MPVPPTNNSSNTGPIASILKQELDRPRWWWHRLTAQALPHNPNFAQRESSRRANLLSTIVFGLIVTDLVLIPATLLIPNHFVIVVCLSMLLVCILALWCNRSGQTALASTLIVWLLEFALIFIIASTSPFDISNLPLFDLLIIAELFAASLQPRTIWVTALFNSIFIIGDLLIQRNVAGMATASLHTYLHLQFYTALARPVALQIIVAVVIFLWVRSTSLASARADRAEMIARLEHTLAEQKEQLEAGVEQILQMQAAVANGNFEMRVRLPQGHPLWPLANALNTLVTRFQRSWRAEQELVATQRALASLLNTLQHSEQTQQPIQAFHTSQTLEPLANYLNGKKLTPPLSQSRRLY